MKKSRKPSTDTPTADAVIVTPDATTVATVPTETAVTVAAPVALPDIVAGVPVTVSDPSGETSFTFTPTAEIARIAHALRAMMATSAGLSDTAETFAGRVAAFRLAWDRDNAVPTEWTRIPANRSVIGAGIMDTQNAVYIGTMLAGVAVPNAAIMAAWRAMVPVTRCAFESKRYGVSALADFASGTRRPMAVPGVPAGTYGAMVHRFYMTDGLTRPWTVR